MKFIAKLLTLVLSFTLVLSILSPQIKASDNTLYISGTISLEDGLAPEGGLIFKIGCMDDKTSSILQNTYIIMEQGQVSADFQFYISLAKSEFTYKLYYSLIGTPNRVEALFSKIFSSNAGNQTGVNIIVPTSLYKSPVSKILTSTQKPNNNKPTEANNQSNEANNQPNNTTQSENQPTNQSTGSENTSTNTTNPPAGSANQNSPKNQPVENNNSQSNTQKPDKKASASKTISGTIKLPQGKLAPKDGLYVYVGFKPDGIRNFSGKIVKIEGGKNSCEYSIDIDSYRLNINKDSYIVCAEIPVYLDDGTKYIQKMCAFGPRYYSSKKTVSDMKKAEVIQLKDNIAKNINIELMLINGGKK